MIYDLIYLDNEKDYRKAQEDLVQAFPSAKVEDASDFIHTYRLVIEDDYLEINEYRLKILELGMALVSFDFELFSLTKPKEALKFIKKWKTNRQSREEAK